MTGSNKATLFCRVSSQQQTTGYSPETQERMGREYAERKGLIVTRVFQVVETASKKAKRREWEKYLEYVRKGPEPHALVASVDRALRNFVDLPEVDELRTKYGKTVHFFLEGLVLDGAHSSQTLRLGMQAAVATWYATELAEKTRRGIDAKARKGLWPTHPPYGYAHDRATRLIKVDPERSRWAVRIKTLAAKGISLQKIADTITAEGCRLYGRPIHKTQVERVIRNPFYAGRYEWPKKSGNWIVGAHEPLVSWELHLKAVSGLERLHKPRYRKHDFLFAGMMRCGSCPEGRAVVFGKQKGRYIYGHCTGVRYIKVNGVRVRACPKAEYVPLETIEEQIAAALETIHLTESRARAIYARIAKDAASEQGQIEAQAAILKGQMTKLETRMSQAYADKLDGKIDESFWLAQQKKWAVEKIQLEEALRRSSEAGPASYLIEVKRMLELAKTASGLWKFASPEEKRELLNTVCLNLSLTGKKVSVEMKTPFAAVAEGRHLRNWWRVCDVIRTWALGQTPPTETGVLSSS